MNFLSTSEETMEQRKKEIPKAEAIIKGNDQRIFGLGKKEKICSKYSFVQICFKEILKTTKCTISTENTNI